jgi:hypothetical protein
MGTKHKHYDVLVAWAAGEEIEIYEDGGWYLWVSGVPPYFEDSQYRIKPKRVKKEGWVNVYKWNHCAGLTGYAYKSKECADKHVVIGDRVACVRIEWEEEE